MSEKVMMQAKKMSHAFVHSKDGAELVNVKFFRGDSNVTQEKFCEEAMNALSDIKMGSPIALIDRNLPTMSVEQFLK